MVTANIEAAAFYRQAQQAADASDTDSGAPSRGHEPIRASGSPSPISPPSPEHLQVPPVVAR